MVYPMTINKSTSVKVLKHACTLIPQCILGKEIGIYVAYTDCRTLLRTMKNRLTTPYQWNRIDEKQENYRWHISRTIYYLHPLNDIVGPLKHEENEY